MIHATASKLHWNYFLALEKDLEVVSRYVEFGSQNFDTYSIEFAHLLFAAVSEVDVIAKLLCKRLAPAQPRKNMNHYRAILVSALPDLPATEVFVRRYGLTLTPWDEWTGPSNPFWWRSYNNVKHKRDTHFNEATLKNALNALGALLILIFHYYRRALSPTSGPLQPPRDLMQQLQPGFTLLFLGDDYYYGHLLIQ